MKEVASFSPGQVGGDCVILQTPGGDAGVYFLSGGWFRYHKGTVGDGTIDLRIILENIISLSLNTESLASVLGRPSAFNLIDFRGQPTLLGTTFQNGTCTEAGCDGNTMYGDNQILSLDMMKTEEEQEWLQV